MFDLQLSEKVYYKTGAGSASGNTALNAFDRALMAAGCGNYNLLKISSILPAGAGKADSIGIKEGSLLPVAYACITAGPEEWTGRAVSAAVAVGIPERMDSVGVIMEFSGPFSEEHTREKVVDMVNTAMKDRGISDYETFCESSSCISENNRYDCAFAYVALFRDPEDNE